MGEGNHLYYRVHLTSSKDSPIIAEGPASVMYQKFDLSYHRLRQIRDSKKRLIFGEHYLEFYPIGTWKEQVKVEKKKAIRDKKRKSKFREHLDIVERMLDIHGNTAIYKDYDKVAAALEKDGYFVKRVHEPERVIRYLTKNHKDVYSECEILTLIRKETREI